MEDEELEILLFSIGDQYYGSDVEKIIEVIRKPEIKQAEDEMDITGKFINFNEFKIPYIYLYDELGLNSEHIDDDKDCILVDIEGHLVGFGVDSTKEIVVLPINEIELIPPYIVERMTIEYMWGIGKFEEDLIFFLDLRNVIDTDKIRELPMII
ncbi:chemotaxis protein CheW [Elusimicrobiota bacterium]